MSAAIPGGRSEIETLIAKWRADADRIDSDALRVGGTDGMIGLAIASKRRQDADDLSALLTAAGSAPVTESWKTKLLDAMRAQGDFEDVIAFWLTSISHPDLAERLRKGEPWNEEMERRASEPRVIRHDVKGSCLVCGYPNVWRIRHEPSGVFVCTACVQRVEAQLAIQRASGAAVTAQAPPPEIEDAFKAGFDAHIRGHRGAKGCASAFAEYVKPNQVPTAAQAPAPTDLERYDAATIVHAKEREQEYRRTIWAAAAALWPNPLRVPQITRDAYTRSSELQTRTDPATGDLLLFAARPSLPVQE